MKSDYTAYPPRLAADVEIAKQRDGQRQVFITGSASVGRHLLLRETEHQILRLLGGSITPAEVCAEFKQRYGRTLPLQALAKFLSKLDETGILAGVRAQGYEPPVLQMSNQFYTRFKLFDPDPLFARMLPWLRWVWTPGFFFCTLLAMLVATLLALLNWDEVASYGWYAAREHYVAIFVIGCLISISHEFTHGLTCKAFGGRATEVGVLMINYFLPALYCNVSGIHLIPQRSRRLWVIAAGVWWQLIIGAFALLFWFIIAPFTLPSDLAFIFFIGSVVDVIFNANPLIKLDGYYFLSQWLRMPNLMDRSRAYWRGVLKRMLFGERNREAARYDRRERTIYLVFGLLSFTYNVAFASVILVYAGDWLIEQFYLLGLALAVGLALLFLRRPLKQLLNAIATVFKTKERKMADNNQTTTEATTQAANKDARPPFWRRRLAPLALALVAVVLLLMPWSASVGNYGTLIAIPDQETIIRAPESASLVALRVRPGDQVANGAIIGQMGNLDVEDQIVQVQSELARASADYDRLLGEMRASQEAAVRAETLLRQRQHDHDEIEAERRQIVAGQRFDGVGAKIIPASADYQPNQDAVRYPAALAVLQADVDSYRAQLSEATTHRYRARRLNAEGLVPRSELDAAETRVATLSSALAAARQRLEAALIEHRRKHASTATEMNLAHSDLSVERLQTAKLSGELHALRQVIATLEARRELLRRKHAQFELVTPRGGAIFGEELPRLTGQYFQKGAEICRVADTRQLLLRVQVPEREIGDIRAGHAVRLKTRAHPDRVFRGMVSKIGGESEPDQNGQATYRVELTIENGEGLLRPGMTAFARIDFGRRMLGRILLHKIKQALRPELWML